MNLDIVSIDLYGDIVNDSLIQRLLKLNYRIEYLYAKPCLVVKIKMKHVFDAIPRLMWEANYLRREQDFSDFRFEEDGVYFDLILSVGECIDYIYKCTPPALIKRVPESISNIKGIQDTVKLYLKYIGPQTNIYESSFTTITQYGSTEKITNASYNGINYLKSYKDGIVCEVIYSDHQINDIKGDTLISGILRVYVDNKDNLTKFLKIYQSHSSNIRICDYDKQFDGYYITFEIKSAAFMNQLIEDSYKKILNHK